LARFVKSSADRGDGVGTLGGEKGSSGGRVEPHNIAGHPLGSHGAEAIAGTHKMVRAGF